MSKAYPLHWPEGWHRSPSKKSGRFKNGAKNTQLSVADACDRVLDELGKMGIFLDDVIISTNIQPTLSRRPRSGTKEPEDCGVAIYWKDLNGDQRCMAIDQYDRVADNLAAVAATLDAMRAIERHGGAEILNRAFKGFVALPEPNQSRSWWEVLEVAQTASTKEVEQAYLRKRSYAHPDNGGNSELYNAVVAAYQVFKKVRG